MTSDNLNPFISDSLRGHKVTIDEPVRRQTLGDLLRRSAKRFPRKIAIICGETKWTYAQFNSLCDRLAAGLSARAVSKGTRVAILARNSHGFAAMRFALARLGAVLVPINFMLKTDEVAFILRHAGAEVLATIRNSPKLDAAQQLLTPVYVISCGCLRRDGARRRQE